MYFPSFGAENNMNLHALYLHKTTNKL
jgi:hypothetical protein